MKKVTAYQCDFCKKPRLYLSRSGVKKHEVRCWLNPARKSCATCANLLEHIEGKEPFGQIWKCSVTTHTPFKKKIDNCPHYIQGGGIFNDYQEG